MSRLNYFSQETPGTCGAAALAMVLDHFGISAKVYEIANELLSVGPQGVPRIKTHQLGEYARSRGLSVTVAKLDQPWRALLNSYQKNVSVILNHRLNVDSPVGHFSVMSHLDDKSGEIWLHDPQRGPDCKYKQSELLDLWAASVARSQIAGNVAVFIAQRPLGGVPATCHDCDQVMNIKSPLKCNGCMKVIEPLTGFLLGCLSPGCRNRLWGEIYCPECDRPWSRSQQDFFIRPSPNNQQIADQKPAVSEKLTVNSNIGQNQPLNTELNKTIETKPVIQPGESLKKLAEALKSLPLPDISPLVSLADNQRSTLMALALSANNQNELSERAKDWANITDEMSNQSKALKTSNDEIATKLVQSADHLKSISKNAVELHVPKSIDGASLNEVKPESQSEHDAEEINLPAAEELMKRLMQRLSPVNQTK